MESRPHTSGSVLPIDALERIHYLNKGLQAIRQIGRLIQTKGEAEELLQQAAFALEATGTYFDIWLVAEGRGFDVIVHSEALDPDGLTGGIESLKKLRCLSSMPEGQETAAYICPGSCGICSNSAVGVSVQFVSALSHGERKYGYMKVSSPMQYSVEENEWAILANVAQDLALALFNIEQLQENKAAELALRESENRYKTIFEGSLEGIVIAEQSTSRVRYANPAYRTMFGYTLEQILGMDLQTFHELDADAARDSVVGFTDPIERKHLSSIKGTRADGSSIHLSVNSQVMEIDEVPCIVAFCTDTTESVERLRKLRRYSAAIHATFEGMLIADAHGSIVDGNAAAADLLGQESIQELLGKRLFDFVRAEDPLEFWERLAEDGYVEIEGGHIDHRILDATASLIRNDEDETEGAICTLRDVTEREQRERETREKNRLLAAVNRLFHDALGKEQFSDVLSHCLDVALDLMDADLGFVLDYGQGDNPQKLTIKGMRETALIEAHLDGTHPVLPEEWREQLTAQQYFGTSHNEYPLEQITGEKVSSYQSVLLATLDTMDDQQAVLGLLCREPRYGAAEIMALYVLTDSVVHVLRRFQAEERLKATQDELRASHESFANIVERSPDGVIVVGNDEIVRFANPSAAKSFETSVEDLTGEWFNASSPDGLSREVGILRDDGYPGTAEMALQETVWEGEEATLVLLRDVTSRKKAETAQLELSRQMGRVIKKLQDLDRTKNEFIANTSHELKTPLNAIMGYLSLMMEGLGGELTSVQSKWVDSMTRQSRTLLGLINQILDFSRMEAGKLQVERRLIQLAPFMQELQSVAMALVKDKPIEVQLHMEPDIHRLVTDPERLQQVVTNLISNAAKFTAEGEIEIAVRAPDEKTIAISVRDSGIGIAVSDQARVFNPFEQVDGTSTRKYGGTGLGLPIVKRLVELLGGTVNVESTIGEGATFTIELPRQGRRGDHTLQ